MIYHIQNDILLFQIKYVLQYSALPNAHLFFILILSPLLDTVDNTSDHFFDHDKININGIYEVTTKDKLIFH